MSRARTRRLTQAALVLGTLALLPSGAVSAQGPLVATARLSSRPMRIGADSGKFLVSLKISGIPEVALRALRPDDILLVDEAGRAYTPSAVSVEFRGKEQETFLTLYTRSTSERLADRQYLFMVPPGSRSFELRVANLKPVRVDASLVGFGR
jgi:hypothetical protein